VQLLEVALHGGGQGDQGAALDRAGLLIALKPEPLAAAQPRDERLPAAQAELELRR
jgi:hypothetical protein